MTMELERIRFMKGTVTAASSEDVPPNPIQENDFNELVKNKE